MPLFHDNFRNKAVLKPILGPRERAQQSKALAALAEDWGSVPSTHTVANNRLLL